MKLLIIFSTILLFLLGPSTIIQALITYEINYRNYFCQNTTTSRNSTYQANVKFLLSYLSSNSTRQLEFYNASAGRDPDDVYGSFLCRSDINTDVCQNCVAGAAQDIETLCSGEKVAIVWYDYCQLRYSNRSFFFAMDLNPKDYLHNVNNISEPDRFKTLLSETIRTASTAASGAPSGAKKFAVREAKFNEFQRLYTLVQCTPDLSSSDCKTCLDNAISEIPSCCDGKQGGIVLSPSCNIRFEIYPFYNATAPEEPSPAPSLAVPPPPPPTGSGKGKSGKSAVTIISIVVAIAVSVVLFCLGCCFLRKRAKKKYDVVQEDDGNEITTVESLQMDLNTIDAATNKFAAENKLGEGGFGEVYKGTLPNGQEIAVKKLSKSSGQGREEFKNEVVLLARLQHRNLVRLLGFCFDGEEKILVYEFVHNKSLDYFLFDVEKQGQLDWTKRFNIIRGIARGILYLHEDSRLRIIHRDLKASNILLDGDMNPKISDFGMAKLFRVDQTQGDTSRIVGTYGYMSPEYAMHGHFSIKSDMYSFGVLVLEIICGKKNSSFYQTDIANDLLSYVWKHWRDGTPMEVLDPCLEDSHSRNEVLRCIQIGLLCVQENPADRPSMATIVLMLNSFSVTLPVPQQPAFFLHSRLEPTMPMNGLESDNSTTKSMQLSVDEESITQVCPR